MIQREHTLRGPVKNQTATSPPLGEYNRLPRPPSHKPPTNPPPLPDVRHMEGLLPLHYSSEAIEIPGARPLLTSLIAASAPWAIVTSGTVPLVTGVRPLPPNPQPKPKN